MESISEYVEKIAENIKSVVPKLVSLDDVDIWLQDEASIGQQGTITRLWVRENHLANRCYSGYEDIVDACLIAWNSFSKNIELIKSLCSRKWAEI